MSPVTWGVPEHVVERFAAAGVPARDGSRSSARHLRVRRPTVADGSSSPSSATFYGPTMNAFAAAQKNGRGRRAPRELEALFTAQNTHRDRRTRPSIPATFLRVTVTV